MIIERNNRKGARWTERARAFAWDYLLIAGYILLLVLLSLAAAAVYPEPMARAFDCPVRAQLFGYLALTLPVTLYFTFSEASGWQASWGKRRRGLRVIAVDGGRLRQGRSFARNVLKFLPWELAHGSIWQASAAGPESSAWISAGFVAVWVLAGLYLVSLLRNTSGQAIYDRVVQARIVRA